MLGVAAIVSKGATVQERWSSGMREESRTHVCRFAAQAENAVHCHHVLPHPASQTITRAAVLVCFYEGSLMWAQVTHQLMQPCLNPKL